MKVKTNIKAGGKFIKITKKIAHIQQIEQTMTTSKVIVSSVGSVESISESISLFE